MLPKSLSSENSLFYVGRSGWKLRSGRLMTPFAGVREDITFVVSDTKISLLFDLNVQYLFREAILYKKRELVKRPERGWISLSILLSETVCMQSHCMIDLQLGNQLILYVLDFNFTIISNTIWLLIYIIKMRSPSGSPLVDYPSSMEKWMNSGESNMSSPGNFMLNTISLKRLQ